MSFTSKDQEILQMIMDESPRNHEVLQKLLDSHKYTISKISHEVRNPLALVYSTLQLIEAQHPETKDFKYWSDMRNDIEFTIQLLQELSNYNNGERLNITEFSSYDFLSKICISFASSCVETSVIFSSTIPKDLPMISGDIVKLREVILNLLKNAKEAISEDGNISLITSHESDSLKIQISDTGCGIPEDHLDTLFDEFVTYKSGGTGLGLAIAKRIASAHGGEILVESKVGVGTRFTLKIPV